MFVKHIVPAIWCLSTVSYSGGGGDAFLWVSFLTCNRIVAIPLRLKCSQVQNADTWLNLLENSFQLLKAMYGSLVCFFFPFNISISPKRFAVIYFYFENEFSFPK